MRNVGKIFGNSIFGGQAQGQAQDASLTTTTSSVRTTLLSFDIQVEVSTVYGPNGPEIRVEMDDEASTLDQLGVWFRRNLLHYEGRRDYTCATALPEDMVKPGGEKGRELFLRAALSER